MDFLAFERMSDGEAEEFLARYLELESAQLQSLVATAREAGLAADFTVESVAPLLLWLQRGTETMPKAPDESVPVWLRTNESYLRSLFELTPESKVKVLRASCYLGETFVRQWPAQLRWATGSRETAEANQPVVTGFRHGIEMSPMLVVENLFARLHMEPDRESDVASAVEAWKSLVPRGKGARATRQGDRSGP